MTSKMFQVQVEVLDKKIESLVSDAWNDLGGKIDDSVAEMGARVTVLDEKLGVLERALGEFKSKDLLTKEDFVKLYEEFEKKMASDRLGLDEIRGMAREVVRKEIEKHGGDGLGMVDFAVASGGALVVRHSSPMVVRNVVNWFSWFKLGRRVHSDANKLLKPSFGEPGQCFPLKGSSGFVVIRLRTVIVPEAVTLEHVDKRVAFDRSSAPKHCQVTGWKRQKGHGTKSNADSEKKFLMTEFTYDLDKSNAQTFKVLKSARSADVDTVRFQFFSNHGKPSFTCIYRVRVHGHEPNSIQIVSSDS